MSKPYILRPALPADEPFLWAMLYEAIYVPEGKPLPERTILQEPALAHYVAGWGQQPGDAGMIAIDSTSGQAVGAAWLRLFTAADAGWGFVDEATPEVSMALLPAYRGQGIGTALLTALIDQARGHYPALSLSVDPQNAAMRLYERLGFVVVGASGTSVTMCKRFLYHEGGRMTNTLLTGRYRHYKGKEYEVLGIARHSETEEEYVVYRTCYGNFDLWIRPKAMFLEEVDVDAVRKPRFQYIGEEESGD